jgi:hypothetical protein
MANSHFSANIITRDGIDGIEYLVIEYDSGEGVQVKFPGGTNLDHPGETPLETCHRETRDETGLVMPVDPIEVWKSPPIKDNESATGGFHTKYAYTTHVDRCAGTLRTDAMVDGKDRLSPPFWRTASELLVPVKNGGLFHSHRRMLEGAIEKFKHS